MKECGRCHTQMTEVHSKFDKYDSQKKKSFTTIVNSCKAIDPDEEKPSGEDDCEDDEDGGTPLCPHPTAPNPPEDCEYTELVSICSSGRRFSAD